MMDYATHSITSPSSFDYSSLVEDLSKRDDDVILVHGLYALYDKRLRDVSCMKIFVDSDPDTRLGRWIRRDLLTEPLKKSVQSEKLANLLKEYLEHSRPEMSEFIFPTKEYADVILPRGSEETGISLVIDGVQPYIDPRDHLMENVDEDFKSSVSLGGKVTIGETTRRFYELN